MKNERRSGEGGFTILEMLVASTLTVIVCGLVLGMLGTVMKGWRERASWVEIESSARAALRLMEEDLLGWIEGEQSHLVIVDEGGGQLGANYSIRLLQRSEEGDPAEGDVGVCFYWVGEGQELFGEVDEERALFRGRIGGKATWEALYEYDSEDRMLAGLTTWMTRVDREDAFLLRNCLRMSVQVWIVEPEGRAVALVGKGNAGAVLKEEGDVMAFPLDFENRRYGVPAYVDVTLWMLAEEGRQILGNERETDGGTEAGEGSIYRQFVIPVTKRIVFRAEGL